MVRQWLDNFKLSWHMSGSLRIKWQDKVKYVEIQFQTGMTSIYIILCRSQLRLTGHIVHMKDVCL